MSDNRYIAYPAPDMATALQAAGYTLPSAPIPDGVLHRFGKHKSHWYICSEYGGVAGDWKSELPTIKWRKTFDTPLSRTQRERIRKQSSAVREAVKTDRHNRHCDTMKEATRLYNSLPSSGASAYLTRKQAGAYGIRYDKAQNGTPYIFIPLRDMVGTIWSAQKIYDDGTKRFLFGGKKQGCFYRIGAYPAREDDCYLCEGYATGATIHALTGKPVFICFDAGNISAVLATLTQHMCRIIIAADNDAHGNRNTGKEKAEAAAKHYECRVVLPQFSESIQGYTDFNDLTLSEGEDTARKQLAPLNNTAALHAVTLTDFMAINFPPRKLLLHPIIPEKGLVMLYAARGLGKTYVSLSVALSIASGTSMFGDRWRTNTPRKVLYIDGEMPAVTLQERLLSLMKGSGQTPPENLAVLTADMFEAGIPDLATPHGKHAIEQCLNGAECIILDNLSALLRQGKENDAESWLLIQEWLLGLRRRGISVLIVHHANKGGGQRGTSKKEDLLDTVITLKRLTDEDAPPGACFTVEYEKTRGFCGEDAKHFEAHLTDNGKGGLCWKTKDASESLTEKVILLTAEGVTQRDIAAALNISPAKVNRLLKAAKTGG